MKTLRDSIRFRVASQHLGRAMIGAIAVNIVKDIFGKQCIEGYVSFNKMMIKTRDQAIKIELFKKKPEILERVNQALDKVGYKTKIVDVILK